MHETIWRKLFVVINSVFMLFMIVICLYPMLYVVFVSLSDSNLFAQYTGLLYKPLGFCLDSYAAVLKNPMIGIGYLNTIFIVVVGVSLNIILTVFGAYFLSRRDIVVKNAVMGIIVFTMFFSGGMIPTYLTVQNLHLTNTLWALILPSAISTYNLIIMRTSFAGLPISLDEAATIDGAGHFRKLFYVILPLSKAIVAVMVLFYGVGHWNAWFNAAIYLNDKSLYPLQLVLREILLQNDSQNMLQGAGNVEDSMKIAETIKYAVIVVATVPILTVYPFLQKYFVKGVMVGALKG